MGILYGIDLTNFTNTMEIIQNKKYDLQESLFDLASMLSEQTDFSEILRVISTKTVSIFGAEAASIVMINPRTQETLKTVIKEEKTLNKEDHQLVQTNIIGWSMKNNLPFLSNDLKNDTRFRAGLFSDTLVSSAMCVPLRYRGNNFGYIVVIITDKKQNYNDDSLKLLERISDIAAPHINNVQKIEEYFNVPLSDDSLFHKYWQLGLLGKSDSFKALLQSIESAARCDVRVVLEGQTGTGKELVAKAIHKVSGRSRNPFIAIDCGAIPENLMESELFGHVRGAFTGASRDRSGLIIEANKGTLFMDEINNLSIEMQSKLLRALQESEVRPVGSNKKINIDVRIISASSCSLSKEVEQKRFREDLFFRLMVYPIYIPTLEERKNDIPLLANSFLSKNAKEQNKKVKFFNKDILEYMKIKQWPGNIRELENFVERLVTFAPNSAEELEISSLPYELKRSIEEFHISKKERQTQPLMDSMRDYEKNILLNTLEENEWNQNKTARQLNILEQTLRAKMKKLGIVRNK